MATIMGIVDTEVEDGIMTVTMNRPERLNALGTEMRAALTQAWNEARDDDAVEIVILTGTGRAFCAGIDQKEAAERRAGAPAPENDNVTGHPFYAGGDNHGKPIIAAVNGYCLGGGMTMCERSDFRIAVRGARFEVSEGRRARIGNHHHGFTSNMPTAIATEMAMAFPFTAERMYELGFLNRLVDEQEQLIPAAREMAEHMLSLPPASRVNTLSVMRAMRPRRPADADELFRRLGQIGAASDPAESNQAFVEKRQPQWKGWDNPEDRANMPTIAQIREEMGLDVADRPRTGDPF